MYLLSVCGNVYMNTCSHRGQNSTLNPLEVELQASCEAPDMVLETKVGYSARTVCALNTEPSPSAPH